MMESLKPPGGQADQVGPEMLSNRAGSLEIRLHVDDRLVLFQLGQPGGGVIKTLRSGTGQVAQHKQELYGLALKLGL
jgi:hypothetical protein